KPRWVAIELTYTQAVKLGLAETRARMPSASPELVASNAEPCSDSTCAALPPPSFEAPSEVSVAEFRNDLTDRVDVPAEQNSTDDFQLTADQDEAEVDEPLPLESPLVSHGETAQPHATAAMPADTGEPRVVSLVAQQQQTMAAPRGTIRRVITT